jgi:hypothetical protein
MASYANWTIDCDICELEQSSEPDQYLAVEKWRRNGGICDNQGDNSICEECALELPGAS